MTQTTYAYNADLHDSGRQLYW